MALTAKQELFAKEYLVDLNATQAAIRAGYSEKTAKEIGCENLTKPNIQEYIKEAMNKRSQKVEIDADYVLRGIKDIADNDEEQSKDRLKAYELMGKHLKLFTENINHTGNVGVSIINDIPRNKPSKPN